MMKHEFEALAGYEVSNEDYSNIIEPMYNDKSGRQDDRNHGGHRMITFSDKARKAYEEHDMLIIFNPITERFDVVYHDGNVCADDLTEAQVNRLFEDLEV